LASAILGAGPVLLDIEAGWNLSRWVSALFLSPLLLGAVVRDATVRGLAVMGMAFLSHSAVVIAWVAKQPDRLGEFMPAGQAYWEESRDWILTGHSPEYDLSFWLPAHFQLLGAMFLFTYISLGLATFWQGLFEVDRMNCYVAQLLVHSHNPWLAVAVGWHPWSLCRGMGYLLITFEVVSLSFARLTGMPLSNARTRTWRWVLGLGFLAADGLIKYFALESVRLILAENYR
jgi:hypothetical protein